MNASEPFIEFQITVRVPEKSMETQPTQAEISMAAEALKREIMGDKTAPEGMEAFVSWHWHKVQPREVVSSAIEESAEPGAKLFLVTIGKSLQQELEVRADNHEKAMRRVLHDYPGWEAGVMVELIGHDKEPGQNYDLIATCENCDKMIWDEDDVAYCEDGPALCLDCLTKLELSNKK